MEGLSFNGHEIRPGTRMRVCIADALPNSVTSTRVRHAYDTRGFIERAGTAVAHRRSHRDFSTFSSGLLVHLFGQRLPAQAAQYRPPAPV
jgi:hypothetical protein